MLLTGVVVGEDGETPIPETEVELVNWDQFWMSDLKRKTDKDGRFSFPPFLTRDGVFLCARHPRLGYAYEELAADACVGDVVVRMKLDAGRVLRIRLVDADDVAVAVAPIYLRKILDDGGDGDYVQGASTGADGRAIVYDLPPGVR